MTTTLPARIEEYTALQAQASFTEAEKAAYQELHKYISEHTKETILWYWELGQKVAKIHKEAEAQKELYGHSVLLRLGKALGFGTGRQLYNAMTVVAEFGTKKEFMKYVNLTGEAKNRLSWSHMVYLAGVSDSELRMKLAAASLEQAWSAAELWAQIKDLVERKARGKRQPTTKIPSSVRGFLSHVTSQADKFVFNAENAWTGDNYDFVQAVKDTPTDKLDEKFVETIKQARARLDAMRRHVTELANVITNAEASVEARLEAQAELERHQAELDAMEAEEESAEEDDVISMAEHRRKHAAKKGKKGPKREGRVGV